MEQGGANLYDNIIGAGYLVVINGDPTDPVALPDDGTGLLNQNLWVSVLFWPGDQAGGYGSDSLTVYWPGAFPSFSTIQAFDNNIETYYGITPTDSDFFIQSTGLETVYLPSLATSGPPSNEYDIYDVQAVPEPGSVVLLGIGLGAVSARRRFKSPA